MLGNGRMKGKGKLGSYRIKKPRTFQASRVHSRPFPPPPSRQHSLRPYPASPETTRQGALGSGSPGSQMLRSDACCVEGPGW